MEKFLTKHTKLILFHWANKTGLHNSRMTVSEWVGLIVDTGRATRAGTNLNFAAAKAGIELSLLILIGGGSGWIRTTYSREYLIIPVRNLII